MATYYVDPSTGSGAGTVNDPTDPYEFESDVPQTSTGDFVLFKRGTTHSTALAINPFGGSNVTYGTYYNIDGSDDILQPKPIIINSTGSHALSIPVASSRIGFRFENLIFRDSTDGTTSRNVNIAETVYTTDSQIVFENCEMYNASQQNVRCLARGVSFINCIMDEAGDDNCYIEGDDMVFRGCTMTRNGLVDNGDCIILTNSSAPSAHRAIVENNYLDASTSIKQSIVFNGDDCIIKNNYCIAGITGIKIGGSNNKVIENTVISINITTRSVDIAGTNNILSSNIIDHSASTETLDSAVFATTPSTSPQIINNVIIGNEINPCIILQATVAGVPVCKNNILVSGEFGIASVNTVEESNNSYWQSITDDYVHYPGEVSQTPTNAVTTDPQLDSNYIPSINGPAYRAGQLVKFNTKDFRGIKFSNPPSIGAYELAGSRMPAKIEGYS
jgi:hypothetical protein